MCWWKHIICFKPVYMLLYILWIISIGSFISIDWHCHVKPISVKQRLPDLSVIRDSMGCNVMCLDVLKKKNRLMNFFTAIIYITAITYICVLYLHVVHLSWTSWFIFVCKLIMISINLIEKIKYTHNRIRVKWTSNFYTYFKYRIWVFVV